MYVEHCVDNLHELSFVPVSTISSLTGFRTIAQWDKASVDEARIAGTVKTLREKPCLIDTLFVDWDNNETDAMKFRSWLLSHQIAYEMYDSGNRSQHFHIPIVPIYSQHAPYTLLKYMDLFKLGHDRSLYHYCSLFRLDGTVHSKTGRKKAILEQERGFVLEIDVIEKPLTIFHNFESSADQLKLATIQYLNFLGPSAVTEGQRYSTIYKLSLAFRDSGMSFETTLELMQGMNNGWLSLSKSPQEVAKSVNDAFKS